MPDDITDLLESQKGRKIMVKLRSGKIVYGILRDFDIHMTMKLESAEESVGILTGGGSDTAASAGPDRGNDASADSCTPIGSVLLRGDNILLISILDGDGDDANDDDNRPYS